MPTLGQRVDKLIRLYTREAELQAQDEGGNPSIFVKDLAVFEAELERLLDKHEL